jgi:hypothetical protein
MVSRCSLCRRSRWRARRWSSTSTRCRASRSGGALLGHCWGTAGALLGLLGLCAPAGIMTAAAGPGGGAGDRCRSRRRRVNACLCARLPCRRERPEIQINWAFNHWELAPEGGGRVSCQSSTIRRDNGSHFYCTRIKVRAAVVSRITPSARGAGAQQGEAAGRWRPQACGLAPATAFSLPPPSPPRHRHRPHHPRARCRWSRMSSTSSSPTARTATRTTMARTSPSRCAGAMAGAMGWGWGWGWAWG